MKTQTVTNNANHPAVGKLYGYNIVASANAVVNLRDGAVGGTIFMHLDISANSADVRMFQYPVDFPSGVYFEVVSGTITEAHLYYF